MKKAKRKNNSNQQPVLRLLAEEVTQNVLAQTTRLALEKIAEQFATDLLNDPEFRAAIKREATQAAHNFAVALKG